MSTPTIEEMEADTLRDDRRRLNENMGEIRLLASDLYACRGEDPKVAEVCNEIITVGKQ